MAVTFLSPEGLRPTNGTSQVVSGIGRLVITSGQVALDCENRLVGDGDFEAQADQVFENLRIALAAGGAGFDDVVQLRTYLAHERYVDQFREIRWRYLKAPFPASTAVVAELLIPGALLEVEALAIVPE